MDKVKFGIIGTGMIAGMHAEAIRLSGNAELVAVYDKDPERARAFAAQNHCLAAATPEELFASGIDAVTIGTPSGLHLDAALPAARAGKHIFCEKPLEVTVERAGKLVSECEKNHVLLCAVFQSRYAESVRLIKKAIDEGRFGTPVLASASIRWYRTPEYYTNAGWRGTWKLDGGGALMNQGIHTADLLIHFNGDPAEVNAYSVNALHKSIEVEDTVCASVRFRNGSLGVIEASTACAPGFPRRVALSGTRGSAVLEDDRIVRWQFLDEQPEDASIREHGGADDKMKCGSSDPRAISCEGHRRQIFEFAEAIRQGVSPATPGSEGKRVVDMICAIYKSAREHTPVQL